MDIETLRKLNDLPVNFTGIIDKLDYKARQRIRNKILRGSPEITIEEKDYLRREVAKLRNELSEILNEIDGEYF